MDLARKAPCLTVAAGKVIFDGERAVGSGGVMLTTVEGARALRDCGLPHSVIDLAQSLFACQGREQGAPAAAAS